jgi:uncharacterized protein YdhG (YjbR/CyaY superfamily)
LRSPAVDIYIRKFPRNVQSILLKIRTLIREEVPEATEKISYGIPTFWLDGNLVHFAALKHHIGFYPTPSALKKFRHELAEYKSAKGSVQFPLDRPIPFGLIRRIAAYRAIENQRKSARKA